MTKEDGLANGQPYGTPGEPGRLDVNGVEWFACDPYPTWFRWETIEGGKEVLHTNPARWADEPDPEMTHARDPEECFGEDKHHDGCDGIVRAKWSGVGCTCGSLWYCL